ncbi:hypothetical protein [Persephonella sp.]
MDNFLENIKKNRYGGSLKDSYNLHEWIYGHRFMAGQTWIEYLLEFLNVLKGFNYKLDMNSNREYTVEKKLGFRRFLFLPLYPKDTEVGKKNFIDKCGYKFLMEKLKEEFDEEKIENFQNFLKTFVPVDVATNRSWFAQFLFPFHESVLFFEMRRIKGFNEINKCQNLGQSSNLLQEIDTAKYFDFPRNFFARGGELYYLMLSIGRENKNSNLGDILKSILQTRFEDIGKSIEYIEKKWEEIKGNNLESQGDNSKTIEIGWITHPNCKYYSLVYSDLKNILKNNLDHLELLNLIAFNIAFSIVLYIYRKSHQNCSFEGCPLSQRDSLSYCAPYIFIDSFDLATNKETRYISVNNLKLNEKQIEKKVKEFFEEIFDFFIQKAEDLNKNTNIKELIENSDNFISYDEFIKRVFLTFFNFKEKDLNEYKNNGNFDIEKIKNKREEIYEKTVSQFYKHFLPIHRLISKQIGFVKPKTGKNARYVLNEHLIKMLICSTIEPKKEMEFREFLNVLFEKYGLIIGLAEAEKAKIITKFNTNRNTLIKNEEKFKEKLRNAGFLVEYSDTTVLVKNPFELA